MAVRIPAFDIDIKKGWIIITTLATIVGSTITGITTWRIAIGSLDETQAKVAKVDDFTQKRALKADSEFEMIKSQQVSAATELKKEISTVREDVAGIKSGQAIMMSQIQQVTAILLTGKTAYRGNFASQQPANYEVYNEKINQQASP